jgi:D-alanyl-D-alanine carboxypeptidase/D-alanyl-D-alanine-endopeptidase (penicillin-binding protein 4)
MTPRVTRVTTVLACLLAVVIGFGAASPAGATTDPLAGLRSAVLNDLRASTAGQIAVQAQIDGHGSFGLWPTTAQAPASNQKVFTAVTALSQLGPAFRFVTAVWTDAPHVNATGIVGGVLPGNLVLRAAGDPSLRRGDLDNLATVLSRLGLRTVKGALYVDDGRFAHDSVAPGWKPRFVPDELGPVAAFSVDRNGWRGDAAYVADPTPCNAQLWRDALARHGIGVVGPTRIGRPAGAPTAQLATDGSAPLSSLVGHMLQASDNFYAEMLLREVGAHLTGHGSRATGIQALGAQARAMNVPLGAVYDGSGLSYWNREAPTELVAWLRAADASAIGPALRGGLPRSCFDGTLAARLCGPWLTGRVRAKTGTLTAVRTLSGFTATPDGRRVVFSVLLAGVRDMTAAQRQLDSAVARLARFTG